MKKVPRTLKHISLDGGSIPNPVLVSRQIEGLREVLRRMKASAKSTVLDPVISQKLEHLARK